MMKSFALMNIGTFRSTHLFRHCI